VFKMAINKCKCEKDYEDEGFKTMCSSCFAKSMNGNKPVKSNGTKDRDIRKQVFLKVASEQLRAGAKPEELVDYAQQIEKAYDGWI